jgi:hypothetical protein
MRFTARLLALASVVTLAACSTSGGSGGSGGPTPSTNPSATPSAAPSVGADFALAVTPPEEPPEVRMAIPGQKISFLVTIADAASTEPVTIAATASGASILKIEPTELTPGVVGEVWVVPDAATEETSASVTITASRAGVSKAEIRSIPILPMADERAADAQPYFERWVAWLVTAHPELGITADTAWEPQFVSTLLVVSHYAYFSADWEMTIAWHNMIPPDDWTEIHLRHRGTESAPSLAFRIDSFANKTEPHAVTPPEVVVR